MRHQSIRQRQYIELIEYHTHVGARSRRVAEYYRDVALPAYQRLGLGPIGVFEPVYGPNRPSLYVLVPHPSVESAVGVTAALLADSTFRSDGAEFLEAELSDPAYIRQERQLLAAFDDMPQVEVPTLSPGRVLELRIYESHSVAAGQKKIDMFNAGGEIALFRKTGLDPVFFGEALFGTRMPNLTYMLSFADMAARDAAWQRFIDDPEWHALRDNPIYRDTVSAITDFILRPTSFSQI